MEPSNRARVPAANRASCRRRVLPRRRRCLPAAHGRPSVKPWAWRITDEADRGLYDRGHGSGWCREVWSADPPGLLPPLR